jgi:hypothetical protein
METLLNAQLWSHPGHGEPQGMIALAMLVVVGVLGLASAAKTRLRPVLLKIERRSRPPG